MGKYITIEKKIRRAKDLTPEEVERMKRSLTKNAKVVKNQKTIKELKKLRKQGLESRPRGRIVEGKSSELGMEFR